jgi:hypothetical protein
MPIVRRVELVFGIMTGLLSLVAAFTVFNLAPPNQFLLVSLLYIFPALIFAFGSCLHAIGDMRRGLFILFGGGIGVVAPKLLVLCVILYGLVRYGPEEISFNWGYLLALTPGLLAIVTMIASLIASNPKS